ncbi:hypothetical protein D9611_008588 [Ephemerocybe angulata]|uniref:Uncharacterized protein n=1 Tax=Ephemerocybe angulata TaxID=980116 RepID=A0A8H5AYW6_9AGAR|nr:hypothetical protein D9611_008588 [Tulosesus angulatus]
MAYDDANSTSGGLERATGDCGAQEWLRVLTPIALHYSSSKAQPLDLTQKACSAPTERTSAAGYDNAHMDNHSRRGQDGTWTPIDQAATLDLRLTTCD